jgi:hypothetical protein
VNLTVPMFDVAPTMRSGSPVDWYGFESFVSGLMT